MTSIYSAALWMVFGVVDVSVTGSWWQSLICAWFYNQVEAFMAIQISINTARLVRS